MSTTACWRIPACSWKEVRYERVDCQIQYKLSSKAEKEQELPLFVNHG